MPARALVIETAPGKATVMQLADAVALRQDGEYVWFIASGVETRVRMTLEDAMKLLDWSATKHLKGA